MSIAVASNSQNFRSIDGVLFNSDATTLLEYPSGKSATSYTIPNGVTHIGVAAFDEVYGLTSITIPDGVESIGESAFAAATSLTSITISSSVTNIGFGAFYGASTLAVVNFLGNAPMVDEEAFLGVASGAKARIGANATGFGAEATWNGLEIDRSVSVPSHTVSYTPEAATNTPAVAVYSPRISVGGKLSAKPIAAGLGIAGPSKSKISLTISKSSKKYCKIKSGKVVGIKAGSCVVNITVQAPKPKKGKKPAAVKKSVTVQIS